MTDETRTFKDQADLQGLTGDSVVELMVLDLRPIDASIDPALRYIRFCNWNVADGQSVYYGPNQYIPLPFQTSGWQMKGSGVPPNPSISVGNIGLEWSGLINTWEDLIGAKLIRRRVLARYLSSSAGAVRTDHWPDEIWYIQQKESENKLAVTFRLASAFDLDGIQLPRRRTLRYTCMWAYRGPECGYTGPPVADVNDEPWTTSGRDTPEWLAYDAALASFRAAREAYRTANKTLTTNLEILSTAESGYTLLIDETFNDTLDNTRTIFYKQSDGQWVCVYYGEEVYRSYTEPSNTGVYQLGERKTPRVWLREYAVRRYAKDTTAIATATANVSTARTAYNAARSTLTAARTTLDEATAAVLAADPDGIAADVCGKRLQSCRLRFGNNATLPFGGFPGLYLN